MAVKRIQLRRAATERAPEQSCTLDGVPLILRARYVYQTDRWLLWTYASDDSLLVGPLPLVPAVDLWRPYHHLAIPPGQLFVESKFRIAPGLDDLDVTVRLLYREA